LGNWGIRLKFTSSGINIEGPVRLRKAIRELSNKHIQCLSLTVQVEPTKVKPFNLEVDNTLWESSKNCGPPRIQSDVKEEDIEII